MDIGTPEPSPIIPSFSKQAAKNGSFLFSPDNMARANERAIVRAQEKKVLKDGNAAVGSITMLPAVSKEEKSDATSTAIIEMKNSYGSTVVVVQRVWAVAAATVAMSEMASDDTAG